MKPASPPHTIRIGTRASALALWQTEQVRARLTNAGQRTTRVEVRTTGDVVQDISLAQVGGRAFFTKQLDEALLEGRIDIAVHSLKDLPTQLPDGIVVAAVGLREDPRDALVARSGLGWAALPPEAVIATSSLRRRAQLLRGRPDLRVVDLRGNVDTRVAKLDRSDEWSGIVLATAGLVRLGLAERISERLPLELMLPAPGQGALAATMRADDAATAALVRRVLNEPDTELAVSAERGFLRRLEGGCQVPVGAYAEATRNGEQYDLRIQGRVVALGGDATVESTMAEQVLTAADAEAAGVMLADRLLARGADAILRSIRAVRAGSISEP